MSWCDVSASLWCPAIIAVSPSIRGSEEVSPLTVIEGSLITLVCESSGIPPPSLAWRKDGKWVSVTGKIVRMIGFIPDLWFNAFQVLSWRRINEWGFCPEAASCRSPALRGPMQPPTPARPRVHLASPPRSTTCRFMVHKCLRSCSFLALHYWKGSKTLSASKVFVKGLDVTIVV